MPNHDLPETQAETDARVERELRGLMVEHGVNQLVDLPRGLLRQTALQSREAGSAVFHRLLLERAAHL